MRALTSVELEVLRGCTGPVDTEVVVNDFAALATLIESGRVKVSWEPHPTLDGCEIARFDATDLGRLALRCALPELEVTS